jgi:hypothetical protein
MNICALQKKKMKSQKTNIYSNRIPFTFCTLTLVLFWLTGGNILVVDDKFLHLEIVIIGLMEQFALVEYCKIWGAFVCNECKSIHLYQQNCIF